MDKVAMYKNQIKKTASVAWKRMYDKIFKEKGNESAARFYQKVMGKNKIIYNHRNTKGDPGTVALEMKLFNKPLSQDDLSRSRKGLRFIEPRQKSGLNTHYVKARKWRKLKQNIDKLKDKEKYLSEGVEKNLGKLKQRTDNLKVEVRHYLDKGI